MSTVRRFLADAIEDAVPTHISSSQKHAPQELFRPSKAPLKGTTELTREDKKRLRRRVKAAKKSEHQQREERLRAAAALDSRKQSALDKRDALKQLSRNKNVTILPKKASLSSTAAAATSSKTKVTKGEGNNRK